MMYERAFMTGLLDPTDFALAESLGRTVRELHETMGNDEYLAWRAYYVYRAEMAKIDAKR
jgi:hypothetical protein